MSPILGIIASGRSAAPVPTSYESIATVTLTGNQTAMTFTSIPQTYKHLQIRFIGRSNRPSSQADGLSVYMNGYTSGAIAAYHLIQGNGSSAAASAGTSVSDSIAGYVPGAGSSANMFGASVIDILDYTDTNKYKTTRVLNGTDQNGAGWSAFFSGLWLKTEAITTIAIQQNTGNSIVQYSTAALYGIKG